MFSIFSGSSTVAIDNKIEQAMVSLFYLHVISNASAPLVPLFPENQKSIP